MDQILNPPPAPETPAGAPARKIVNRFDEETWRAAIAMYLAGATAKEVAACFGMSASRIHSRISELGLTRRSGATATPEARVVQRIYRPDEVYDAAIEDYLAGMSGREVCAKYGIRLGTLHTRLSKRGESKKKRAAAKPPDPDAPSAAEVNAAACAAWRASAHAAQLPPEGAWATWLFQGGRGAGKTRAGAEWLAARAGETPDGVFALVGATMRDVREVMIDGPSGLMHLPGRPRPRFEVARQRLTFASGAVAYAFSSQEPERLRGPQFNAAWADEFCAWRAPQRTLETLRFALRRGPDPRLVVTTTPKPITALRNLKLERSCAVTQAPSAANAAHLSPGFFAMLNDIYAGTRLAIQELDGVMVEGSGALWKAKDLESARGARPAACDEIVVAVDPPAGVGGAACGIVVVGRRGRRAYVLADATVRDASPLGWAHAVRDAAAAWDARSIVAEANQGGHMVRATLASADVRSPIRLVHARDGKRARAEPVAALYERGRVTHCGAFTALEEELMALGEPEMEGRLDRADALVWAVTHLLVDAGGDGPRLLAL